MSVFQDRYLPPPRPSYNSYHLPLHSTARQSSRGAEYSHTVTRGSHASDDLRRTESRTSQHHRQIPPSAPSASRTAAPPAPMPPRRTDTEDRPESDENSKPPVDWVKFFGGKPPAEIITIHDDDSPPPAAAPPPAPAQKIPPASANSSFSSLQHVDKKRRVNGSTNDAPPTYSTTNTPHLHSNGTSTESLLAPTAATSVTSQASASSRIPDDTQVGQKRKRTRTSGNERKKQEIARAGPAYLREYGEYAPPVKQYKKQKEVVVPSISDVRLQCVVQAGCAG